VTTPLDIRETDGSSASTPFSTVRGTETWTETLLSNLSASVGNTVAMPRHGLVRYPQRLTQVEFYCTAYPLMYLSRHLDERMEELFKKGYARGTVTTGIGNEATAVGMCMPLRPGRDVVSIMHRDAVGHIILGATPYQLFCQFMANAQSPTHGREGNAHHGNAAARRFPMISHLGKMPSLVIGGTWAARRAGEDVFGLAVVGDGGTSTGEIHESLNMASVQKAPVLLLIENNYYAFSTPLSAQYNCRQLSDRAQGYGIKGRTIDGTDAWEVYSAVCDAIDAMREDSLPYILECMTLRLRGHAVYDKGDYISAEQMRNWLDRDPLPKARRQFLETSGISESEIAAIEQNIEAAIQTDLEEALSCARPDARAQSWTPYAPSVPIEVEPFQTAKAKNGDAVNLALDYLLSRHPNAFLLGLDIGRYGSAFKTCKGLMDRHGSNRVIDMPLGESAMVGLALGASQVGGQPIIEFQFADFSTETVSQLGLNCGTWYYRAGCPAPILLRFPCGGGLTMGAFHSGEFEGLWSRFAGLKLLYPATAQETFEALLAGFYDPNPCLVFEHKLLYWSKSGPICFDGHLANVWRARNYVEGEDVTLVAFGAMVHEALAAAGKSSRGIDVWNPFVLQPLALDPIVESVRKTGRLAVVQECGMTQGLGEMVIARVVKAAFSSLKSAPVLISAPDMPVPFAPELELHYRPNAEKILTAIENMFI
jgi:2-oxoisovalerate dehydrogenase E1 component